MMKFRSILLLLAIAVLFTACAQKKLDFGKPEIQVPKQPKEVNQKKGALYSRQGTSLFADKKDLQVGDIIQVVISEELTNDSNSKRDIKNSRGISNSATITPNASVTGGAGAPGGASRAWANKFNATLGTGISSSGSNNFKGEVKSNSSESFETIISVIIEQSYQNGNYYVKGSKEMLIDEQMQEIVISGVIRPYDISPDNSINSTQMANLKIMYKKDGQETDVLRVPWLFDLLIKFWPL